MRGIREGNRIYVKLNEKKGSIEMGCNKNKVQDSCMKMTY